MPNNELQVVNSILKNKDIHTILGEPLELFPAYGDIVDFIKDYYSEYKSVPGLDLVQGKYPDLDEVPVDSSTKFYIDDLKSDYLNNQLQMLMLGAAGQLDKGAAPGRILSKMTDKLAKLTKFTESVKVVDLKDFEGAAEYYREVASQIADKGTGALGIPTGFTSIDSSLSSGGFVPGDLVYVAGYSGKGKSWWTGLVSGKMWVEQDQKPMFVSLEMSPEAMRNRIYNMLGEGLFDMSSLARGDLNYDDYFAWANKKLEGKPSFHILSGQGGNAVTPNIIRGSADVYKPNIIVVDYVQIMSDNAGSTGMTEKVNNLAYELKRLATSLNAVIFAVTAVKDDEGGKRDSPPTASQIMYSRSLEYSADAIVTIHKHEESGLVECSAIKNRNGDLWNFLFDVDFGRGIWKEMHD